MKFLAVKPLQETLHKGWCGPAVLKMVLAYYGVHRSEAECARLAGASPNTGVDDKNLVRVLKKFGLTAKIQNDATLDDVKRYLDKKIPVIVDWFTRGRRDYSDSAIADGHYSVVVGIDAGYIYLQDPEIGRIRKLEKDDFLKVWFDYRGEYFLNKKQLIIRQLIAVYQ